MRPSGVRIRFPGCGSACSSPVSSSWRQKQPTWLIVRVANPSPFNHNCAFAVTTVKPGMELACLHHKLRPQSLCRHVCCLRLSPKHGIRTELA